MSSNPYVMMQQLQQKQYVTTVDNTDNQEWLFLNTPPEPKTSYPFEGYELTPREPMGDNEVETPYPFEGYDMPVKQRPMITRQEPPVWWLELKNRGIRLEEWAALIMLTAYVWTVL